MANQIEELLAVVDAYCKARGISEARASTLIFNGGGRVKQLRDGRDIGVLTAMNALIWLSSNWPDAAEWPASISRPQPSPSAPVCQPVAAHP